MAAGVAKPPSSYHLDHPFASSPLSYPDSARKLPTFTSIRSLSDGDRSSSFSKASRQHALRSTLRGVDTKMTTTATTTATTVSPSPLSKRSESQNSKAHKRAGSNSSTNSPSVPNGPHSVFATPYATYEEEPFPDIVASTPTNTSSTPKIRPYLRKISSAGKEDPDQGRLDLSKSVSENSALAGLGITDFAALPRPDGRTTPHARNTSVGSTLSSASGSFRPTQPFVHPMRQLPNRPYSPATDASSLYDAEVFDTNDMLTAEDMPPTLPIRAARTSSMSSVPALSTPTPLSQSHTAADLGQVPKLTSTSQSNLSIHSSRSLKSSRSRIGRPRTDTNRSIEYPTTSNTTASPSTRTSIDKTFSFVSRRSDSTETPQTRDERIAAARRKFEEKEAHKDRKAEAEQLRRRQSESVKIAKKQSRRQPPVPAAAGATSCTPSATAAAAAAAASASDKPKSTKHCLRGSRERNLELRAMRFEQSKVSALPLHGVEPGRSEKVVGDSRRSSGSGSGMQRSFSSWLRMRLLCCGKRA